MIKKNKSGPGENRTLVQTGNGYAFYMLSPLGIFEPWHATDKRIANSLSCEWKFRRNHTTLFWLFPNCVHHYTHEPRNNGFGVMSRPKALLSDKADLLIFNQAARA